MVSLVRRSVAIHLFGPGKWFGPCPPGVIHVPSSAFPVTGSSDRLSPNRSLVFAQFNWLLIRSAWVNQACPSVGDSQARPIAGQINPT